MIEDEDEDENKDDLNYDRSLTNWIGICFLQYDVLGYKYLSDGNSSNKFIFIISMFVDAVDGGVRNRTSLKTGIFQKRFEL
ncbi:N-acetyltransferase 10-like [Sarcoptes scabiei]|nr:N-acetyltransferase 10-like [Sarcoptes scabiei]